MFHTQKVTFERTEATYSFTNVLQVGKLYYLCSKREMCPYPLTGVWAISFSHFLPCLCIKHCRETGKVNCLYKYKK